MDATVSIGEVKRDVSKLVNRVAYGGERIVHTSHGVPIAALVSMEDYRRLQAQEQDVRLQQWESWLAEADELAESIRRERAGKALDVDRVVRAAKDDLEARYSGFPG